MDAHWTNFGQFVSISCYILLIFPNSHEVMKMGVISQASGSSYIEIQNTKVICGVYVFAISDKNHKAHRVFLVMVRAKRRKRNTVNKESLIAFLNMLHLPAPIHVESTLRYVIQTTVCCTFLLWS